MSGVNSTTAALGGRMSPSEVGKQAAAEADIHDFLREAGDALSSNTGVASAAAQMPRRKMLQSQDAAYMAPVKTVRIQDPSLPLQPFRRPPSPVSRTYYPAASSVSGLSRAPSVLDSAPNFSPPADDDYVPYRRSLSPDRPY